MECLKGTVRIGVKGFRFGYVYVIKGKIGGRIRYYIGSTKRALMIRWHEHAAGESAYTKTMNGKKLVYFIKLDINRVRHVENYLKKKRRIVYSLVGKKYSSLTEQRFWDWCKEHNVEITNYGKMG
jgi:predicted GIY-YIG superfamily endonuclease